MLEVVLIVISEYFMRKIFFLDSAGHSGQVNFKEKWAFGQRPWAFILIANKHIVL